MGSDMVDVFIWWMLLNGLNQYGDRPIHGCPDESRVRFWPPQGVIGSCMVSNRYLLTIFKNDPSVYISMGSKFLNIMGRKVSTPIFLLAKAHRVRLFFALSDENVIRKLHLGGTLPPLFALIPWISESSSAVTTSTSG